MCSDERVKLEACCAPSAAGAAAAAKGPGKGPAPPPVAPAAETPPAAESSVVPAACEALQHAFLACVAERTTAEEIGDYRDKAKQVRPRSCRKRISSNTSLCACMRSISMSSCHFSVLPKVRYFDEAFDRHEFLVVAVLLSQTRSLFAGALASLRSARSKQGKGEGHAPSLLFLKDLLVKSRPHYTPQ